MNIFITLAIVLFFAKVGGYISKRFLKISDVGEVIVGMIIGPGVLALIAPTEFLHHLADIGIVLMMFLMGLEFDVKAFEKFMKGGIMTAVFGAFVPFFGGLILASSIFKWPVPASFIFATILMATSVSVTITVLNDMKRLHTPLGYILMDAAVVDDVLGVGMLTLVLGLVGMETPSLVSFGIIGLEIIIFFAAILIIGPKLSKIALDFGNKLDFRIKEGHLSMLLITLFVMTFIAHSIGLSIIIGAFLTGVIFDKTHIKKIQHEIYSMTYGLFIPIFFVYVGSFLTPATLIANWYLVLLIVLVASAGKFVGSFLGSSMSGTKLKDSAIIGIGMMGRCEVALIIAVSARKLGLFSADIYTIIVSSIILTVIIAPIMLRYVITKFSK